MIDDFKKIVHIVLSKRKIPNFIIKRLPLCKKPSDDDYNRIYHLTDIDEIVFRCRISCILCSFTAATIYGWNIVTSYTTLGKIILSLVYLVGGFAFVIFAEWLVTVCSVKKYLKK